MKMDFVLSTTTDYAMKMALLNVLKNAEKDVFGSYIVVAPETKTLEVERFLLDNSKNKAFANIYIYSFNRLLKRIQIKQTYPLSKEAGVMIVRNLIMNLSSSLMCYKKTAGTVGFAENIYETIQQLKSSNISPIELSETAKKCATALRIKLEDIALIYDAYENYLGEELLDASDKLIMLEKQLEISDRIKSSHIFVVGFDSLTVNACSVIKGFVKNALSVTVSASFMHQERKNAHIADNEVFEHLKKVAEDLHIKYNPIFEETPLCGDFKHIFDNLFSYPPQKTTSEGNIELIGFPNLETESKYIASQIKQAVLKGEVRYKDCVVYLADENLRDLITRAFEDFEMPYFVANPYEFENHQLFVFVKLLFSLIRKNLEAEDFLKFVRNALLDLDFNMVDDFENYVLKFGINHGKFLKPFVYKEKEEVLNNAETIRRIVVNVITEFSKIYNENMTIGEVVASLKQFFDWFEMDKKLLLLADKQLSLGEKRSSLATGQVFVKVNEVLDMLNQFLGSQKTKLDEFYTLLISGLESADISLLPLSIDSIQIVSSQDGLYDVKNLYVLGAVDGNFPRREQDLGLIQDSEIMSLEGLSEKKIEPTIKTINRRERFKIFELLQFPKNKLCISFSEHVAGGEEAKMSSLLQSLASLFLDKDGGDFPILKKYNVFEIGENERVEDIIYKLGSKKVAINFLADCLSKYKQGVDFPISSVAVSSLYKALLPYLSEDIKNRFENINIKEENCLIENAKELFFNKGTTSISQLERYFTCPFKHFADYGLKLKDREQSNMKALDVGDILHEVAENFIKIIGKKENVNVELLASNLLKKSLSNEKYSEEENRILIKILESEAKRLCLHLFEEFNSSEFKPTHTEKWFGAGGEFNGILLNKENGIELVGKIDRVDQTDKYYRIIDYKTGKIDSGAEDIYYGRKLQLALYLSALDKIKKQPAGVLYFPIKNEFAESKQKALEAYKMKGFILSDQDAVLAMDKNYNFENRKSIYVYPEIKKPTKRQIDANEYEFKQSSGLLSKTEMESISSYAKAVSEVAIKEIIEGYNKPSPFRTPTGLSCQYCEYKNICGIASKDYSDVRESTIKNVKDFYLGGKIWEAK